tara:strand:+ start:515 stop:1132 length:618 start_codon:yes stop_codon:yes gene_type:complete
MKNLQAIREEFLRQASEFDTGKKEEDFHAYLKRHNLEHHLSQTQIADRNRNSNSLNSMGLVAGIAVPLTLGAIYGMQKLTSNIIGHGGHDQFDYEVARQAFGFEGDPMYVSNNIHDSNSLSGHNIRSMPLPDRHVNQDRITGVSRPEQLRVAMRQMGSNMISSMFGQRQPRDISSYTSEQMEDDVPLMNRNDPRYNILTEEQYYL